MFRSDKDLTLRVLTLIMMGQYAKIQRTPRRGMRHSEVLQGATGLIQKS
jgi:hypothetical protein